MYIDRFLTTGLEERVSVVLVQVGVFLKSNRTSTTELRDYIINVTKVLKRRYAQPGGNVVRSKNKEATVCVK